MTKTASPGASARTSPPPKPDSRVVFSTEDRLNRRGVRARAKSWGWSWVHTSENVGALYVSMGISDRHQHALHDPRSAIQHQRCPQCGYAESCLIGEAPRRCPSCQLDALALLAMWLIQECGENTGWLAHDAQTRHQFLSECRGGYAIIDIRKRQEKNARRRVPAPSQKHLNIRGT